MPEKTYTIYTYRLRAGSPMPTASPGSFVTHTFMAEKGETTMYACTESLPGSREFRGQGGNYMSANFSRLNVKGGTLFTGKIINEPEFVDEDNI